MGNNVLYTPGVAGHSVRPRAKLQDNRAEPDPIKPSMTHNVQSPYFIEIDDGPNILIWKYAIQAELGRRRLVGHNSQGRR